MIRPNLVFSTLDIVLNILVLASLSFLGLGVQPPTAEWGLMVADGQTFLLTAWWISTMPGLVIVLAGVGFSLIGDGLADRLGQGRRGRAGENEGMILSVAEEGHDRGAGRRPCARPAQALRPPAARGAQPPHRVPGRRAVRSSPPPASASRSARARRRGSSASPGSGKSVTLRSLLGLVPEPGRVIDGEVLLERPRPARACGRPSCARSAAGRSR